MAVQMTTLFFICVSLLYILNSFENYIIMIIMQIGLIIISCFAVKKFKKSENPNYKLIALIFPIIVVLQIFLPIYTLFCRIRTV